MAPKAAAAAEGDADFKGDGRRAHGQPRWTLVIISYFQWEFICVVDITCVCGSLVAFSVQRQREEKRVSLSYFLILGWHCVNTLMILHASHTLMMSAG
jgi:hypothetical protein